MGEALCRFGGHWGEDFQKVSTQRRIRDQDATRSSVDAAGCGALDASSLRRTFTEIVEAGLINTVKTKAEIKVGCARFFG